MSKLKTITLQEARKLSEIPVQFSAATSTDLDSFVSDEVVEVNKSEVSCGQLENEYLSLGCRVEANTSIGDVQSQSLTLSVEDISPQKVQNNQHVHLIKAHEVLESFTFAKPTVETETSKEEFSMPLDTNSEEDFLEIDSLEQKPDEEGMGEQLDSLLNNMEPGNDEIDFGGKNEGFDGFSEPGAVNHLEAEQLEDDLPKGDDSQSDEGVDNTPPVSGVRQFIGSMFSNWFGLGDTTADDGTVDDFVMVDHSAGMPEVNTEQPGL